MTVATKGDQVVARTLEVERSVLGGILVDPDLLTDAQEFVTERDFFRLAHQIVFDAIARLANTGKPIDTLTVVQALTAEELEDAGGPAYVASLIDGVPMAMNVGYYAQLVREFATRRGLERAARRILHEVEGGDATAAEVLEDAERLLFALRDRTTTLETTSPRRRVSDTFAQIEALTARGGALLGVPTGLRDLDTDLRGLRRSNVIIVAARPSMGKSALALTIAVNAAAATRCPALFFSLEMSAEELNIREATMRAQVDNWKLTHGRLTQADQQRLAMALQVMEDGGVHLVDAPTLTVAQMRAMARRAKTRHGLALVVIDYVQLVTPDRVKERGAENRTLELGSISRQIKGLARELDVPVLLLSQLSRAVEGRHDKRPQLSDLRESGALEQDADVVLLLFRPNSYKDIRDTRQFADSYVEANIAKQRNGPTGPIKLTFLREYTKFVDFCQ
jgi:replicative DNA helicase